MVGERHVKETSTTEISFCELLEILNALSVSNQLAWVIFMLHASSIV